MLALACFLAICGLGQTCLGATANETLVVANQEMTHSVDIARYYMKRRHIPANHLVVTSLTTAEEMEREEYDAKLKKPVLAAIAALAPQRIAAVVLIYGVPLKVGPPSLEQRAREELSDGQRRLWAGRGAVIPERTGAEKELQRLYNDVSGADSRASVDSELALVKVPNYPLAGWIENPYFIDFQKKKGLLSRNDVLLVCRLDGPDPATVRRLIDDSLAVEKKGGLRGIGYFDARWPLAQDTKLQSSGYHFYDGSLYAAAKVVARRMPVKIDKSDKLFPPHSAPRAALYAGWYSLGKYIDSFSWVRGAVGYHIASSECATLRDASTQEWCVQMLEHGVAATIGPVHEPYVQGFPVPAIFFRALTEGYLNLGESYLISLPYLSWQMVLVGDPLYRPFTPASERR